MNKGFTLIELLVVIAIIGVLAGVVMVSFPSATKKAKIGNALSFSDNVRGSLQPDMVAWWKFDETSGTVAKDTWWNQLHGTVSGATWVEGIKGNALSFDGNDYVTVPNNPSLVNYTGLALEAWIKPSSDGVYGGILNKYYYPGNCYLRQFLLRRESSNRIGFWMGYNNGASAYVLYTPTTNPVLASDGWTHIVATWSGSLNTMKIYLNGKVMASYTNALSWTTNTTCNLEIGRYYTSGYYFNGLIDDVQIYSAALPVSVIQQHYADGLATHQNFLAER